MAGNNGQLPPNGPWNNHGGFFHSLFMPMPAQGVATIQPAAVQPAPVNPPAPTRPLEKVVCVVCGGVCKRKDNSALHNLGPNRREWMYPMLIIAKPEYNEWRKDKSSAKAYKREDDRLFREMTVLTFRGGADSFRVQGLDKVSVNTSDSEMAIPIHSACLALSKRFCRYQSRFDIDFRSARGGEPSSIAHLYEIWCKRAIATCPHGVMTEPIKEPHNYFGAPRLSDPDVLETGEVDDNVRKYKVDPWNVPNLTQVVVLNNLQPMKGGNTVLSAELAHCKALMEQMPQEVYNRIIEAIEPFEDGFRKHHLEPTRVLPGTWWKEKLMSGQLIPWLCGLDSEQVTEFRQQEKMSHSEVFDEDNWDWERLCRQLAHPGVFEEGGILHDVSINLWNRRRIWKLLSSARLGHLWSRF